MLASIRLNFRKKICSVSANSRTSVKFLEINPKVRSGIGFLMMKNNEIFGNQIRVFCELLSLMAFATF